MKARIYIITNDVDDKIYVGVTTKTINRRLVEHKSDTNRKNMKLHSHMKALGMERFHIELIEEIDVDEKNDVYWHEGNWIELFRSNGYQLLNTRRSYGATSSRHNGHKVRCYYCEKTISVRNMARHVRNIHKI